MGHSRNIRCLVWLALASGAVVKLDAHSDSTRRALPKIGDAVADSRAGSQRRTAAVPRPFAGFSISDATRDSIVRLAQAQVGRRYVFGGTSPQRGFDCSGFVRYVLSQVHLPLPRLAAQQARTGAAINRDEIKPGDLVAFGGTDSVSHIGIYVGDGKFVHASSAAGRVTVSKLDRAPSLRIRPLRGARRMLAVVETSSRLGGD